MIMGAALKGVGTFLPGIAIHPDDRKIISGVFGYGLPEAALLLEEGMNALHSGNWNAASAKAGTLYMLAGKYSTKFGNRDTAIRLFIVADYLRQMSVQRKKAAARAKKSKSMMGLAFKLARMKAYTTALSR
jgi:hypothetical protein